MKIKLSTLFKNCAYKVKYETIGNDVNYAFVEDKNTLYIYFQHTNSKIDWIRNALFFKRPYKGMKIPYFVHGGFLRAWKEVEDVIIEKITQKTASVNGETVSYRYKFTEIIISGFSHGGALSGLCHECVWYHRPDIRDSIFGFGFESPRFYRGLFVKKELRERWKNYTVIRNHNDLVTFLPPRLFFFTHVGKVLHLNETSTEDYNKPKSIGAHYPDKVLDSIELYESKEIK